MYRSFAALLVFAVSGALVRPAVAQLQTNEALVEAPRALSTEKQFRREETTAEFSMVVEQVNEFVKKHGVENVLLVLDLDNTLLAMNQDLGSDQWFTWQEDLQKKEKDHPDLVSSTFDGLLEVQGVLFALSSMHPPEPDLPAAVGHLLDDGVTTIVLTSRGKEFRNSAARELKRHGYDLPQSTLEIKEKRGVFLPYDASRPTDHGLNAKLIGELGSPRSVTYADGVYMTAGQHKGYMLQTLLARVPGATAKTPYANYSAIVFVDDHEKHTKRMQEAFAGKPIDLATFRYSREDGNVERFKKSTKHHVIRDWDLLNGFTKTVLVK